jgi:triacylglycerol lipase
MPRIRHLFAIVLLAALPLAGAARLRPADAEARRPALAGAPERDPILFVHGWRGNRGQWRPMIERFKADGWTDAELYAWTFDTGESNAVAAARISARVDQILAATRAARVDVVTHSMGALSSRYYLKHLRSAGKVDAWVSLGGPNHGTTTAHLCFSAACREMRPGSPFLAALNEGDETPGEPRYATWWSPCDEVVDPDSSVLLDGAANHQTECITHLDFFRDAAVYRAVRDFVSGEGRQVSR